MSTVWFNTTIAGIYPLYRTFVLTDRPLPYFKCFFLRLSKILDPFLEQHIRFHCPIAASFNFVVPKARSFTRRIYKYDACNYNTRIRIQSTDCQNPFDPNIDIFTHKFTDTISSIINKCVPSKLVRINPSDKPH